MLCVTIAYRYFLCMGLLFCIMDIDANICAMTSITCCSWEVEQAINDAAFENTSERHVKLPLYTLNLNESDRVFFPHYGQCILYYVLVTCSYIFIVLSQ